MSSYLSQNSRTYEESLARLRAASEGARSTKSSNISEVAGDIGGVRLDALSLGASPPRHTNYNEPPIGYGGSPYQSIGHHFSPSPPRNLSQTPYLDDVFTTPGKTLQERRHERVGDPVGAELAIHTPKQYPHLKTKLSNPNNRHEINGVDAQQLYPPAACIFVANLPEPRDDSDLEAALTSEFMKYGVCFIKIRRDNNNMPFAFVQYTSEDEAKLALNCGRGAIIFGRPCRTEMVKANRYFIVQKRHGNPITVEEAKELLAPFGRLQKCEFLHHQIREPLGFSETVLAEFSMFDAARDLSTAFRNHAIYNVSAFDMKKSTPIGPKSNHEENYQDSCDRARRSIFVGDLAAKTTREDVTALFSEVGRINAVNVLEKPIRPGVPGAMAFVEFAQPNMPDIAIQQFHGTMVNGSIIRVERKVVRDRATPRHSRSQFALTDRYNNDAASYRPPSHSVPESVVTPTRKSIANRLPANAQPFSPAQQWPYKEHGAAASYSQFPPSPFTTASGSPGKYAMPKGDNSSGFDYDINTMLPSPYKTPRNGPQVKSANQQGTADTAVQDMTATMAQMQMYHPYAGYYGYWPGMPMPYMQDGVYPAMPFYPYGGAEAFGVQNTAAAEEVDLKTPTKDSYRRTSSAAGKEEGKH